MNYDERMTQFCEKQCVDRKECEYVLCKNTFRCDYLSGIMYGWELGQNDTLEEIEKAMKECDVDDSRFTAVLRKIEDLNEK